MNKEEKFELAKDTIASLLKNYTPSNSEYDDLFFLWDYICELKCLNDIYQKHERMVKQ